MSIYSVHVLVENLKVLEILSYKLYNKSSYRYDINHALLYFGFFDETITKRKYERSEIFEKNYIIDTEFKDCIDNRVLMIKYLLLMKIREDKINILTQ